MYDILVYWLACRSAAASVIKNEVGGSMRIPILVGLSALFLSSAGFEAGAAECMARALRTPKSKIGQTVPYSGPASAFSSYGRVMIGYFQESGLGARPRSDRIYRLHEEMGAERQPE
jgi:hypothetical protein